MPKEKIEFIKPSKSKGIITSTLGPNTTPQTANIIKLMAIGYPMQHIARELGISIKAVNRVRDRHFETIQQAQESIAQQNANVATRLNAIMTAALMEMETRDLSKVTFKDLKDIAAASSMFQGKMIELARSAQDDANKQMEEQRLIIAEKVKKVQTKLLAKNDEQNGAEVHQDDSMEVVDDNDDA